MLMNNTAMSNKRQLALYNTQQRTTLGYSPQASNPTCNKYPLAWQNGLSVFMGPLTKLTTENVKNHKLFQKPPAMSIRTKSRLKFLLIMMNQYMAHIAAARLRLEVAVATICIVCR